MNRTEISIEQLEQMMREAGLSEYPKPLGNGLYKLSENCITNREGYEMFMEELMKYKKEKK